MCIITNELHKIISISLVRGVQRIPSNYHVYEYVSDWKGISIGDIYPKIHNPEYQLELGLLD